MGNLTYFVKSIIDNAEKAKFIKSSEIYIEGPIAKIRLIINHKSFIQVFYNEKTVTKAYSLIKEEKRLYGIDKDSIRDWHEHPYNKPHEHIECEEKSFKYFLEKVGEILENMKDD
jgi:hypothetical protein